RRLVRPAAAARHAGAVTVPRWLSTLAAILLALVEVAAVQAPLPTAEIATARYFASVRNEPPQLLAFLNRMPKGGDLHNHLSGAIYAESYLRWGAEDNLCLATATMSIVAAPCDAGAGRPPVADVLRNSTLYNQAINA